MLRLAPLDDRRVMVTALLNLILGRMIAFGRYFKDRLPGLRDWENHAILNGSR